MLLKIYFRSIKSQFFYFLIKVIGLALALMFGILVFLFAKSELGYDHFHKNASRLYRVATYIGFRGGMVSERTPFLLSSSLKEEMPNIEKASHLIYLGKMELASENQKYSSEVHLADDHFFDLFSFEAKQGNTKHALSDPNSIIISERLAREIYEDKDPIGKSLTIFLNQDSKDFQIAAIIQDVPENSSIQFDLLLSDLNAPLFMGGENVKSWTPFKSNVVTFSEPSLISMRLHW